MSSDDTWAGGSPGAPVEITKDNVLEHILAFKELIESLPKPTGSYWVVGVHRGRRKPGRRIPKRLRKKLFAFRKIKMVWREHDEL